MNISYSALAVADALLSSTSRANSLRLLRSTCVFTQRLDGAVPTTVSDSKWPNPFLDLTHTDKVDPKRFWAVDGFHPGTFGYVVMADAIMRLLFDGAKE